MAVARKAPEWMELTWMRQMMQADWAADHKEIL